ncbi:MAG: hypothetical protein DRP00_03540 [Candidatus Aenigmatarchaeota archaeon]|nr:MAG: hypothetical protein DRP00_03540 [Candidatus Aenigmarchaeota archaeon]
MEQISVVCIDGEERSLPSNLLTKKHPDGRLYLPVKGEAIDALLKMLSIAEKNPNQVAQWVSKRIVSIPDLWKLATLLHLIEIQSILIMALSHYGKKHAKKEYQVELPTSEEVRLICIRTAKFVLDRSIEHLSLAIIDCFHCMRGKLIEAISKEEWSGLLGKSPELWEVVNNL